MTVYLKRRFHVKSCEDQVYHTSKDCQHYQKSVDENRFKELQKENVPENSRVCKECSNQSHRKGTQNRETFELLSDENFTPEDADMTPMGER